MYSTYLTPIFSIEISFVLHPPPPHLNNANFTPYTGVIGCGAVEATGLGFVLLLSQSWFWVFCFINCPISLPLRMPGLCYGCGDGAGSASCPEYGPSDRVQKETPVSVGGGVACSCFCFVVVIVCFINFPILQWWYAALQKRLAWALFVLLLSPSCVVSQQCWLFLWDFRFHTFSICFPPLWCAFFVVVIVF